MKNVCYKKASCSITIHRVRIAHHIPAVLLRTVGLILIMLATARAGYMGYVPRGGGLDLSLSMIQVHLHARIGF